MENTHRQESDRIIGKLKVAIRLLGFTNREIERRLEYTPSYLTRLFSGQIELRFEHVVDIARAMGLTADEFFAFAYPPRNAEPSEAFQQLNDLLDELRPAPPHALASKEADLLALRQMHEYLVAEHLRREEEAARKRGEEPGKTKGGILPRAPMKPAASPPERRPTPAAPSPRVPPPPPAPRPRPRRGKA